MPVPTYPSDDPEPEEREWRDPREIIRDIIGGVSTGSSGSPHNVGM